MMQSSRADVILLISQGIVDIQNLHEKDFYVSENCVYVCACEIRRVRNERVHLCQKAGKSKLFLPVYNGSSELKFILYFASQDATKERHGTPQIPNLGEKNNKNESNLKCILEENQQTF